MVRVPVCHGSCPTKHKCKRFVRHVPMHEKHKCKWFVRHEPSQELNNKISFNIN